MRKALLNIPKREDESLSIGHGDDRAAIDLPGLLCCLGDDKRDLFLGELRSGLRRGARKQCRYSCGQRCDPRFGTREELLHGGGLHKVSTRGNPEEKLFVQKRLTLPDACEFL